jgi:hypothetical protein
MTDAMPLTGRLRRVAPLAAVLVLAAACGDDDKGTATPQTPPGTTTTTTTTGTTTTGTRTGGTVTPPVPTGSPKASKNGTLVMGTRDLLPLLQTSIRRFAPTQVEGHSLKVVALAGPTSFWAGRNRKQRILVTMRLKGGDAPKIKIGQKTDFIGLLTIAAAGAGAVGVRNIVDRTLLEKQGAYVDASVADVKLR